MLVTFLLDENKKHFSATEKVRKGICSKDLLYMGYLFSEILIDISESALKYSQKLQVFVFFDKIRKNYNYILFPPTSLTNQNSWEIKKERERRKNEKDQVFSGASAVIKKQIMSYEMI